jgi:hypothetical protein
MRHILAVIAVITSSSALAAPGPASATLAAPARADKVITDAGMWHCDGTTCAGMAGRVLHEAVAACTSVADGAGRVAAFTAVGYTFGAGDLVRCNRHVKP